MAVTFPALDSRARSRERLFHGWIVLGVAAAAMVGTLPGRTQGLGLVTEPLLADLGLGRVEYAKLNLWATLIGSTFAVGTGRVLDRLGSRVVLTTVALVLGAVVCAMSRATSQGSLAFWLTLTRAFGQSALSVVSFTMVGHWFVRKIDRAMALYSVLLTIGFMACFPLVGKLVQEWGWRGAWFAVGCTLMLGLAPLALFFVRRGPEVLGFAPDGERAPASDLGRAIVRPDELPGHTWRAALASAAFWVFALGTALYALVASGIGLFNESILAERGFAVDVYHQTLAVTAVAGLAGNFLGGWLAGRLTPGRLLAIALFVLAGGVAVLPLVTTLAEVMAWAVAMGLGGGIVMVLFFAVWARVWGRRHLGRIQGAAQAITVLASALGPLLLAWCVEWTGSYRAMFEALAVVIAVLGAAALVVRLPAPPETKIVA